MGERKRRATAPQIQAIAEYWEQCVAESDLGIDWVDGKERCWRCGCQRSLERCHIVPDSLGGSNTPDNFVLLCNRCHIEAPNVADARFIWIWLRNTRVPLYDTFWQLRAVREFEDMFGRTPFAISGISEKSVRELGKKMQELIEKATVHFGHPDLNSSTFACLYALAEEELVGFFLILPKVHETQIIFWRV